MKKLEQTPVLGFDDEPSVNVAVTTLAFKNSKVINLLRERGEYIMNEKWAKVDEISEKINELKKNPKDFEELTTPCSVFMTFETEEGYERAKQMETAINENPNLERLRYWITDHEIEI